MSSALDPLTAASGERFVGAQREVVCHTGNVIDDQMGAAKPLPFVCGRLRWPRLAQAFLRVNVDVVVCEPVEEKQLGVLAVGAHPGPVTCPVRLDEVLEIATRERKQGGEP